MSSKISALTPGTTPAGTELIPAVQGGSTVSLTVAQIAGAAGGGDALTSNPLSQFASTTSAELRGVLSDETGTGAAVFATAPTLSNPVVGTQSPADNSTKAASTAYVDAAVAGGGGGGLSDFTDNLFTASPNASTNVAQLIASGTSGSIAIALSWKGSGYLTVDVPDNTTAGGNVRGAGSVDFQTGAGSTRTSAGHAATGAGSGLFAATDAAASGAHSAGVATDRGQATGDNSLVTGARGVADADNAFVHGFFGSALGVSGVRVHSFPGNNSLAEKQAVEYPLRGTLLFSTSPKTLKAGGMVPAFAGASRTAKFSGEVVMYVAGGAKYSAHIAGMIAADASLGGVALVGTPTVTEITGDATGLADFSITFGVDTGVGGLNVQCNDSSGGSVIECICYLTWILCQA